MACDWYVIISTLRKMKEARHVFSFRYWLSVLTITLSIRYKVILNDIQNTMLRLKLTQYRQMFVESLSKKLKNYGYF